MLTERAQQLHTYAINTPPFGPDRYKVAAKLAKSVATYTHKEAVKAFLPVVAAAARQHGRDEGGRAFGKNILSEVATTWAVLFETEHGIKTA